MYDLPKRPTELVVEFLEGAVKLVFEPLTDDQYLKISEGVEIRGAGDEQQFIFLSSRVPGLFQDRLRKVEGIHVDGTDFDPSNPQHVARLAPTWKTLCLTRLVRQAMAMGLTETDRGNSGAPAPPSSTG
jgi:hypothetical protein